MNRAVRYVLTLSAAAAALAAAPARADHDRDCDRHAAPAVVYPEYPVAPAPPAYQPAPEYGPAWSPIAWRFHELREEYRRLDWARDRFYSTWNGNPWRRDRFEAWYGARRAELDRRRFELARWRDHGHWEG
jgi:hypothetical protein